MLILGVSFHTSTLFAANAIAPSVQITLTPDKTISANAPFTLGVSLDVSSAGTDCQINGQDIDVSRLSFSYDSAIFSPAQSNTSVQSSSCQSDGKTFHLLYQTQFTFLAKKEGIFSFGPAKIVIGDKNFTSKPLSLQIQKEGTAPANKGDQNASNTFLPNTPVMPSLPDTKSEEVNDNGVSQFNAPTQALLWVQNIYTQLLAYDDWYLILLLIGVLWLGYRYALWASPKPSYQDASTPQENKKEMKAHIIGAKRVVLPDVEDEEFAAKISFLLRRHLLPLDTNISNLTWNECLAAEADGERKMLLGELIPLLEQELYRQSSLQSRQNIYTLAMRILSL